MRIAFYDPNRADYHVGSVFERPLGGTQSAACYLAMELAGLGHEVIYLAGAAQPCVVRGVACPGRAYLRASALAELEPDVLVVIQQAGSGAALRKHLPARARLIFWTADTAYQELVTPLKDAGERDAYDAVITVSAWQREQFATAFPQLAGKLVVLRYGMSPAFQGLFPAGAPVLSAKAWPPILAYTSTPFRGLDVLLHLFPEIRRRVPGARLQVFSGMRVYFIEPLVDAAGYRALYEQARATEGVDYVGNVAQAALAERMTSVSMLCYPNTYEETACISVMEALAAGCAVLTSALGALPETLGGRGTLIDPRDPAYVAKFVEAAVELLEAQRREPGAEESRRRQQVDWARATYDWPTRAREWDGWLRSLAPATGG